MGTYYSCQKEVVINLDGERLVVKTVKSTVKEVLKQSGINITEDDYVSVPLDTKLKSKKGNVIDIKKAVPVTVIADGPGIQAYDFQEDSPGSVGRRTGQSWTFGPG